MVCAMGLYTSRHPLARFDVVQSLFLAFVRHYCRLRVEGVEHIPAAGAFVLAANHASHADTAAIFAALPRVLRRRLVAAAARDYFFDRGLKQFVSRILFNTIPVARNPTPGEDPLRHVLRALREGYGVLLYPEGTRSTSGAVGRFRSGIGRLIAEFPGMPIIPVWIAGTVRVLPKRAAIPLPRPYAVWVRFGVPLQHLRADPLDKASWRAAAEQVREAVIQLGAEAEVHAR